MTDIEVITAWARVLRAIAFVILYIFIGFGPGFIIGIILANRILGKGQPTYHDLYQERKKKAFEHNAQWDPANERWKKS